MNRLRPSTGCEGESLNYSLVNQTGGSVIYCRFRSPAPISEADMASPPDTRVQELHLTLPPAPKPMAVYKPAVRVGNLVFCSGHGPLKPDGTLILGRVGNNDLPNGMAVKIEAIFEVE